MVSAIRFVHVLSALFFFGGLLPYVFLYGRALRQPDRPGRLAALRVLSAANRSFMLPGSILSGLTGFALSGAKHVPITRTPWLLASVLLYLLAFLASMMILAPHTRRVLRAVDVARDPGAETEALTLARDVFPRAVRLLVGLAGIAIAVLMITRPR